MLNSLKIIVIIFLILFSIKSVALANITVSPEEILIERGWTKYVSFLLNNNGDADVHNVNISIEGYYNWLELQKNTINSIASNNYTELVTKVNVPSNTETGSYNFSLEIKTDEMSAEKNITVRVFEDTDALLLYQINGLRDDLSTLETQAQSMESSGTNMAGVKNILRQIRNSLDYAEANVTVKMYGNVTGNILSAQKLFIEAEYDLANPPKPAETGLLNFDLFPIELIALSSVIIASLLAIIIFLVRKNKISNRVRIPNLKLKEAIVENGKMKDLERDIEKTRESQRMIEEEYRNNIISKESYDELRLKYQQRLSELENEIKKARGY